MFLKNILHRHNLVHKLSWFRSLLPFRSPQPKSPFEIMDIAYSRFASDAIKVIQDISESHFVAFDLEFSGVAGHSSRRTPGKPSLQEIYEETRLAAAKYQILQVGLTVVKEDLENGQYIAKPYNFNISPLPTLRERTFTREWSMSSGAVQFLLRNRFDFSLPLITGIPYLSRAEEVQARMSMNGETDRKRPDMTFRADDEPLIKHVRQSISKWLETPEENKEDYINIPNDDRGKGVPGALNRYQSRLTHQIVQNEFPDLKTIGMSNFVQITNPSREERERQKTLQQEHVDREIGRAIGFRWILEAIAGRDISGMPDECFLAAASQFGEPRGEITPFRAFVTDLNQKLSKRRSVLIGHNCFTDLVYLYRFFIGELPERVEDFQDSIHEVFPAVVDTKSIASFGNGRWGDTSLAAVEEDLRDESAPKVVVPDEFDRYSMNEKPHEAGYDALLTANIAIKLSTRMEREGVYFDRETPKAIPPQPQSLSEPFGTKGDGYVTASEELDSQTSDLSSVNESDLQTPVTYLGESTEGDIPSSASAQTTPVKMPSPPTSFDTSSVVAVKEKKPKPPSFNSTTEVGRVRNAFTVVNMYDVLDKNMDGRSESGEEDLMSFGDPDSPSSKQLGTGSADVAEMVKQGKLMPRWDGGHGFWQVFGNKLQVNPCKEGVCNL